MLSVRLPETRTRHFIIIPCCRTSELFLSFCSRSPPPRSMNDDLWAAPPPPRPPGRWAVRGSSAHIDVLLRRRPFLSAFGSELSLLSSAIRRHCKMGQLSGQHMLIAAPEGRRGCRIFSLEHQPYLSFEWPEPRPLLSSP